MMSYPDVINDFLYCTIGFPTSAITRVHVKYQCHCDLVSADVNESQTNSATLEKTYNYIRVNLCIMSCTCTCTCTLN